MSKTSLKISLSPRDIRLVEYLLPHQLKFWHEMVDEVLLVLDLHGYNSPGEQPDIQKIHSLIDSFRSQFPKTRLLHVDYSLKSRKEISKAYFKGKDVPAKTHRYGPYYSYFFGIYHTTHDYVLNIDCDIFFGGFNPSWLQEAIALLKNPDIITCSPHPGPPPADGRLLRQEGKTDNSELRKIIFNTISTRIFFIHKPSFQERVCPIPIKLAKWPLLIRALIRKKPLYELPEDTISDIMKSKGLKRIDFLGTNKGIWTLHPPYRNEEFYHKLPEIIERIENNNLPEEQRGDYDLNHSMIDWSDAIKIIKNNSLKRKLKNVLNNG